jgi:hypothetical protein
LAATTEGKKRDKGPRRLVSIRLDEDDVARIDALAAGSPLALDRSALIRACLRLGLELAERDPGRLLRPVAAGSANRAAGRRARPRR